MNNALHIYSYDLIFYKVEDWASKVSPRGDNPQKLKLMPTRRHQMDFSTHCTSKAFVFYLPRSSSGSLMVTEENRRVAEIAEDERTETTVCSKNLLLFSRAGNKIDFTSLRTLRLCG
jgi:hypothetical protein